LEGFSIIVATVSWVAFIPVTSITGDISFGVVGIPADLVKVNTFETTSARAASLFGLEGSGVIFSTSFWISVIPITAISGCVSSSKSCINTTTLATTAHCSCLECIRIIITASFRIFIVPGTVVTPSVSKSTVGVGADFDIMSDSSVTNTAHSFSKEIISVVRTTSIWVRLIPCTIVSSRVGVSPGHVMAAGLSKG
jgi:hypothetical protein